ncbi:hypothetical protein C4569_01470 [Candidatus Parcubacteria bacterium]|nr:MAG: hypothetical protein C4569_01470 [Candidatus Parcubacteria bacterium]
MKRFVLLLCIFLITACSNTRPQILEAKQPNVLLVTNLDFYNDWNLPEPIVSGFVTVSQFRIKDTSKINDFDQLTFGVSDYIATRNELENKKNEDCDGLAFNLWYDLWKMQIPAKYTVGRYSPQSKMRHAWIELNWNGFDYILDPSKEKIYKLRRRNILGTFYLIEWLPDYDKKMLREVVDRMVKEKVLSQEKADAIFNEIVNCMRQE